jgi:hypothetical protein
MDQIDNGVEEIDNAESAHTLLKAVYKSPDVLLAVRMRAAMACLAFETPKLAVTVQITEQDFATLLDRRLKRLEEMKLIEANGAKVIDASPQPVETKPPLARTPDRRFRRF